MKEAYLYKKLPDKKVHCQNCAHYCLILPGKRGVCGVRENIDGKLYSLVYGKVVAVHFDPIEKNLFFIFCLAAILSSLPLLAVVFDALLAKTGIFLKIPNHPEKLEAEIYLHKRLSRWLKNTN